MHLVHIMSKVRTTITLDKAVVSRAKELEINISSFTEMKLIEYIAHKEKVINESETNFDKSYFKNNKWTERDLNPRPLPCEGSDLPS